MALNVAPHGGSSGLSFVSEYRGRGPTPGPASVEGDLFWSQRTSQGPHLPPYLSARGVCGGRRADMKWTVASSQGWKVVWNLHGAVGSF